MRLRLVLISGAMLALSSMPVFADSLLTPSLGAATKSFVHITADGAVTLLGTLKANNSNSLTVSSFGGDWTVTTNTETKFLRKHGSTSNSAELSLGDSVRVDGSMILKDTLSMNILARSIRDESIQKRDASFQGTIMSMSGDTFTLATDHRGAFTVSVSATTKITLQGKTVKLSELTIGTKVIVSGLWNTRLATISAEIIRESPTPTKEFRGTISQGTGGTLTIKLNGGGTLILLAADAHITSNKKPGETSSLALGTPVLIRGSLDGSHTTLTADTIKVLDVQKKIKRNNKNDNNGKVRR